MRRPHEAFHRRTADRRDRDLGRVGVLGFQMPGLLSVQRPRVAAAVAALAAALSLALIGRVEPARADACPGASVCPYVAVGVIGQRGEGVLRFPQAVAVGPDGLVYVGDQFSHVVQVFTPTGQFVREVGSAGSKAGQLDAIGALGVGADNTLYVGSSADRVDRFAPDGSLLQSWGRGGNGPGQFRFGRGFGNTAGAGGGIVVVGGKVFVADTANNRIQRFNVDGSGGTVIVPPGRLLLPQGIAAHKTRLIVADDDHHRLVVFDTGGHFIRTIGSGPGSKPGQLSFPYDVATDLRGHVFVADDMNHRVVRFDGQPAYRYRARWGGFGTGAGQLEYPRGLAADAVGDTFVANTGNQRIEVFDPLGEPLRSFGIPARSAGQFTVPLGVGADASGIRAVTDSVNGRVQLLNPDGTVAAQWGSPAPGPTILPDPVAVAFDGAGAAYVLDQQRGKIVVFDRSGNVGRTIGSSGSGPGQMLAPSALAIDASGNIYVADTGNGRLVRFGTDGSFRGTMGYLGSPRGVAVTTDGSRIYADDASNNRIQVFGPDGSQLAQFGGTGNRIGKLNVPAQMALDAAGNLWVADRGNNRIQEFGPNGERLGAFGQRGIATGQFVRPTGVSVDCHGLVTVTDTDSNRVQQFQLAAPAPSACASLPPVASPPAPKLPTQPPPLPPVLTTTVLRRADLFSQRTLPLRVVADRACTLTVSATVTPRKAPKKGKPVTAKLKSVRLRLSAGRSQIVRPALSLRDAHRLRKALKGLRGMVAKVQLTAATPDGPPVVVSKQLLVSG